MLLQAHIWPNSFVSWFLILVAFLGNASSEECYDKDDHCGFWKKGGECEKNPKWMSTNCALSCGTCSAPSHCFDTHIQCVSWAASGECKRNALWMLPFCALSCGNCSAVATSTTVKQAPVTVPSTTPLPTTTRAPPPPTTEQTNGCNKALHNIRVEALHAANAIRLRYSAANLVTNANLENQAQKYADTLLQEFTSEYDIYGSGTELGENINLSLGGPGFVSNVTGFDVVNSWYSEQKNYDFDRSTALDESLPIEHFTQLVWKASTEVGIGYATNEDCSMMIVVANFYPRGNDASQMAENVGRLHEVEQEQLN